MEMVLSSYHVLYSGRKTKQFRPAAVALTLFGKLYSNLLDKE